MSRNLKYLASLIFVIAFVENKNNKLSAASVTSKTKQVNSVLPSKEPFCNEANFYQSYTVCTCHEACSLFNTCCSDEEIYCNRNPPKLEQLTCTETPYDGFVYMKNTCLPNYPSEKIVQRCVTTDETSQLKNFFSLIPVTTPRNITYKNLFCAVCNNEESYTIWNFALRYESENQLSLSVDPLKIVSNITFDIRQKKLVSKIENSSFTLEIQPYLPLDRTISVKHCGPTSVSPKCSICERNVDDGCSGFTIPNNTLFLPLSNSYLRKLRSTIYQLIFENPLGKFHFSTSDSKNCKPIDDKNACLVNKILQKKKDFNYVNNDTIILLKENITYGSNEWSHTLDNDFIYFCGRPVVIPPTRVQKLTKIFNEFATVVLDFLSSLFLLLLLIIISTDVKKKLKGLAYKVTFSTSFTEFILYVVYNLRKLVNFGTIFNIILHFLCLSYFAWVLVAAYNLWDVICYQSAKLEVAAELPHFKKYLLYCLFGWGLPFLLVLVATYFEFASVDEIPCKLKPTYGSTFEDNFFNQEIPFYYFFLYPITAMCLIVAILFAHTIYRLFTSDRNIVELSNQNHYFKFYLKLAFAMGVTWTIYFLLSIYKDNLFLNAIRIILDSSQGIFMFFAYGFEKQMIGNIYEKISNIIKFSSKSL